MKEKLVVSITELKMCLVQDSRELTQQEGLAGTQVLSCANKVSLQINGSVHSSNYAQRPAPTFQAWKQDS